jgi:uncharacterized protein YdcH (DUF465 family)
LGAICCDNLGRLIGPSFLIEYGKQGSAVHRILVTNWGDQIMSHVPHELAEDFPEFKDKIHQIKAEDKHFDRITEEYHKVNREIHRLETRVEAATEEHEQQLRRQRMALKDEILFTLNKAG